MSKEFLRDSAERVGVSAGLAAISTLIVVLGELPYEWVPVLVLVLNSIKVLVAQRSGDPESGGFVNQSPQVAVAGEAPDAPEGFETADDDPIEAAD